MLQSYARTTWAPLQLVHSLFRLAVVQIDRVQGANMRTVVSSLSSSMGLLEQKLKLIRSSATLEHASFSGFSRLLKVGLAFTRNREQYLRFLRRCADYGEIVTAFCAPPITGTWPASSHMMESLDLRDRAMRPQFGTTGTSAESAIRIKGLS
jgi:hypothetical protein